MGGKWGRRVIFTCQTCGIAFTLTASQALHQSGNYCSKKCRYECSRVDRICEVCGKHFKAVTSVVVKGKAKYCTKECYYIAHPRKAVLCKCEQCGKEFEEKPSNVKRRTVKYCSHTCKGIAKRGANNHNWRGGHKYNRGSNWDSQRKAAYQRDGGICQICKCKPKKGQRRNAVHHIIPYRLFDGNYISANDLLNLITLCQSCHVKVELSETPVPKRLL